MARNWQNMHYYGDNLSQTMKSQLEGIETDLAAAGGAPLAPSSLSCWFTGSNVNCQAVGLWPLKLSGLKNNLVEQASLGAIPANMRISAVYDGSSPNINVTQDGLYTFHASLRIPKDTTAWAYLTCDALWGFSQSIPYNSPLNYNYVALTVPPTWIPAGTNVTFAIITQVAASAAWSANQITISACRIPT